MGLIEFLCNLLNIKDEEKLPRGLKFGEFQCPIGETRAEIVPAPSIYQQEYIMEQHGSRQQAALRLEVEERYGKDLISALFSLHNFKGDNNYEGYLVLCPKMNLNWEDDGGCFSVQTNVPGTCTMVPAEDFTSPTPYQSFEYKWCPYLPNLKRGKNSSSTRTFPEEYNPIAKETLEQRRQRARESGEFYLAPGVKIDRK